MPTTIRIGIVGDFDRCKHSHWATEAALFHAGAKIGLTVEPRWISTTSVAANDGQQQLGNLDGVWGAPGSPFASMNGMLAAIQHAREREVAYLGTCAGFQYALIELTRNVLGILDADSAENSCGADNVVITAVQCPLPQAQSSGPRLTGLAAAFVEPGTLLERLCATDQLLGEYLCSFEASAAFLARWQAAGLRISARGSQGEMRAFELPSHRFFLATLFQPQLLSSFERPHPLVVGFLRACALR